MITAVDLPDHSGRACYLTIPQMEWISRYGVIDGCVSVRLPTVLSLAQSTSRSEFTVISRNLR
jgi:hypothetical protein